MVAIIISIIALVVASLAYFKPRRATISDLKYEYTKDSLIFYDRSGKRIVIKGGTSE